MAICSTDKPNSSHFLTIAAMDTLYKAGKLHMSLPDTQRISFQNRWDEIHLDTTDTPQSKEKNTH